MPDRRQSVLTVCLFVASIVQSSAAIGTPQDVVAPAPVVIFNNVQAPGESAKPGQQPAAESSAPSLNGPVLHLKGGGFITGELKNSDDAKSLTWQSPSLRDPLVFGLGAVSSVNFPLPKDVHKSSGEYSFELSGGDLLFGSLVQVNDSDIEIETHRFGKLKVARENVQRVYRWKDGADLIYLGPNGLNGWKQALLPKDAWREESGQLVTSQEGAAIVSDLKLPDKATIEFEIGWSSKPDFDLAFGTGPDLPSKKDHAFHIEVWDGNIVVQRETEQEADVESILEVGKLPKSGQIQFIAYIDQTAGRVAIYSIKGQKIADIKVAAKTPKIGTCISLTNKRGDVRLERLRISRWNGDVPKETLADQSRIHLTDGSIVYGKILRYENESKSFVVESETDTGEEKKVEETNVPADRIQSLFFPTRSEDKPRSIRIIDQEGARLSGELLKVENNNLLLKVPGLKDPVPFALSALNTITPLTQEVTEKSTRDGAIGFLELDGARIEGQLVDAGELPDSSCLAWKPILSSSSSPLKLGVSGKINYRDPLLNKPAAATPNQPQIAQPRGLANLRGLSRALGTKTGSTLGLGARNLYLRTGDVIPSEITKIDEEGLTFKTPLSDSTFVSHAKVKAVELGAEPPMTPRISKTKRDRLLTLPRMQKDTPPLQLVRSMNGDYLRGRVIQLDDKTLQIETRLETKKVPRDRISKIIWLHPEETDPSKKPAKAAGESKATRVQVVRADGVRLTFSPESVAKGVMSGKSDVLGACRVPLKEVDQILIGDMIEKTAAQLAYQQWKLQNAPEPKSANPDDGSSPAMSESPLVGKPAPPFALDLLDGKRFKLEDLKGKVVVLDFWASWCGPCIESMPQVVKVADEFKDQGVELVTVNLQESNKQIASFLERQKLKITVALDIDAAVSEKYEATSIPQTVIIDRDGKIAYLWVGVGNHVDETLRNALKSVLDPKAAKPEIKK